ncbi:MAG: hypothetical protein Q9219_001132 [cf. Caloplaca sp. 3 TL-2023]
MRRNQPNQPNQPPNNDFPQVNPIYSSNNPTFPNAQIGMPLNAAPWPAMTDTVQQGVPQTAGRPSRAGSGGEHTKHRRTRSGCYTCRQRRVKSSQAQTTATIDEESNSEEDIEGIEDKSPKTTSPKIAGKASKPESGPRRESRGKGATSWKQDIQSHKEPIPSIEQDRLDPDVGNSPGTDGSSPQSASQADSRSPHNLGNMTSESSMSPEKVSFSHLPQHQRYYLEYLRDHITYHHYFFRSDTNYFIHNILVEHALSYEPLLYAVVGFAAFHATLKKSDGKIQDFLGYYNRSLPSRYGQNAICPTVRFEAYPLQEYLGDWVNLLGHHKAAYSMLTELHTAESIMESEVRRKILAWYSRFDLFLGFMSGYQTVLGREWFAANHDYHVRLAQQRPGDIHAQIEAGVAGHRILAMDMALLFAKLARGVLSFPEFSSQNVLLAQRIQEWKNSLEPLLSDDRFVVKSFEDVSRRDENDIVDPYRPGGLYQGPLWGMNFLMLDWLGTNVLHTYQTALTMKQPVPRGVVDLALEICRVFETVEYWPQSAPGSILAAQAALGVAALFLPKEERYTMWVRRKLAKIESQGYTYPPTLRDKMATMWDDPEIQHWWLPNEEGYPPIIRSIHAFTEERTSKTGGQPVNEDIRNMKGLLEKLDIKSPKST